MGAEGGGCSPAVPATREAEAGESLEHRRQRLWWAKILPLHSSLADRVRLHLKKKRRPGTMAHAYNPSILGSWDGWIRSGLRPSWPTWWNPVSNTKISWVWCCMPVIPAAWETEAGESLEPQSRRLQWAEISPLHSSLGNKSKTPSQKKNQVLTDFSSFFPLLPSPFPPLPLNKCLKIKIILSVFSNHSGIKSEIPRTTLETIHTWKLNNMLLGQQRN